MKKKTEKKSSNQKHTHRNNFKNMNKKAREHDKKQVRIKKAAMSV